MDADRFDTLLRSLTGPASASRRGVARFVIGLTFGGLGLAQPAAAARSGKCKPSCGECERCDKGKCEKKNGKKRCKRGKCKAKPDGISCAGGTCQDGRCTVAAPFCTGKNACEDGNVVSTCQRGATEQCVCLATADTGAPFCALNNSGTVVDCLTTPCPAGQTCVDFTGGECPGGTACAEPCPDPL